MKVILAINAGSSSVKISVYSADFQQTPRQVAETQISGLTAPPARLTYSRGGKTVKKAEELQRTVKSQDDAFRSLVDTLLNDAEFPIIKNKKDIAITCHRIVHGGDYSCSQLITHETYHHLEALSDLAPLHNSPALAIVRSCVDQLPDAVNVACFDSQFHSSLPAHTRTYPINQGVAKKNRLRKYGFHGISYSFITRSVAGFLGKDVSKLNIIALHLGSGASACAIKNGRSWDTSMGLTPLAGLPGATRSGSVDPSLVFHYASDVGKLSPQSTSELHITQAEDILNKQSGWKSLTGTTDFSTIVAGAQQYEKNGESSEGDDLAARKLALDIFVDRVSAFIGGYFVTLEGKVDALVFAGGIGEKSGELRRRVAEKVACLGFDVDPELNGREVVDTVQDIGKTGNEKKVLVCQTDEQLEMARFCAENEKLW